jgi:hypothetical protein
MLISPNEAIARSLEVSCCAIHSGEARQEAVGAFGFGCKY